MPASAPPPRPSQPTHGVQLDTERTATLTEALRQIAAKHGLTLAEMRRDRNRATLRRELAEYLQANGLTLAQTAELLGYRHHTSVLYLRKSKGSKGQA